MIARFPRIVSRSLLTAMIAGSLGLGAVSQAQILPQQMDPALIFGWITVNEQGNIGTTDSNTVTINVPTATFFSGRVPSVGADGSLLNDTLSLTAMNAQGLSFTLDNARLVRTSGGEGDFLQLEMTVTDAGAINGVQNVMFQLVDGFSGNTLNFGVQVNVQ